ncbi:dehydrogenase/reductase SDR family protein 7-like [Toxorhynchites rutilus septentrionalis]|uniref:dehydrogenase/reductase SDR family protein 7-like n=1 Tax=Toxorhynchites rutilus septentrionalis TaxID=329112 RepID=UPI00247A9B1C|nr:dehydrogenase/reductase SDR family protein 7-like [Toxorhynchites rutilus septentrionalis]
MKSLLEPDGDSRTADSWFWWILSTVCLPFTFPYVVLKIIGILKEKRYRECLPGKVVVITGASSGLGESLAHTFFLAGCKVVLAARRKEELERVRKELLALHTTVTTHSPVIIPLDLSDITSLPGKIKEILEIYGQIDILINNGGISVRSDCISTSLDVDIRVMLVNYFGTVALTKACLPSMIKRQEGRIVCVSSIQGKISLPHRSAYGASKHALQAFCDCLRAEMAENNIKVTLVSPGYIKTALSLNALTGAGKQYGEMDDTTSSGMPPEKVSERILQAILRDSMDVTISDMAPKLAYWIRHLCPSLYFWIMARRAKKIDKNKQKKLE